MKKNKKQSGRPRTYPTIERVDLKDIIDITRWALLKYKKVYVRNLGIFFLKKYKARKMRNNFTGRIMKVPERSLVIFKADESFRNSLKPCRHLFEERAEGIKCVRGNCEHSYLAIGWGDPRIKKIKYIRQSKREYLGKK